MSPPPPSGIRSTAPVPWPVWANPEGITGRHRGAKDPLCLPASLCNSGSSLHPCYASRPMRFDFLVGLMVEAVAILIVAKVARDLLLKMRGYDVNQMIAQKKSVGAATTQAGYLIGVSLGF